jgi:hypothetical protein
MARQWQHAVRRIAGLAAREAPRLVRAAKRAASSPGSRPAPPPAVPRSPRPAGTTVRATLPSDSPGFAGRRIDYAPDLDGRADPGEVVWTWVPYEDDPRQGKDRPVLVIGRERRLLLGLMLSSNADRDGQRHWLGLGTGSWDRDGRRSWVRLDRVLEVDEDGIRREGAVLDPSRFDRVAAELRSRYGWA